MNAGEVGWIERDARVIIGISKTDHAHDGLRFAIGAPSGGAGRAARYLLHTRRVNRTVGIGRRLRNVRL